MQISSVNEAKTLLHQLQGRQEIAENSHWMWRTVRYLKNIVPLHLFTYPTNPEQQAQSLIKKIARYATQTLDEPKGFHLSKELIVEACKSSIFEEKEVQHYLLFRQIHIHLESNHFAKAKRLLEAIHEVETLQHTADVLADELRLACLEAIETDSKNSLHLSQLIASCDSCFERLNGTYSRPIDRAKLYRTMLEQDAKFAKLHCENDEKTERHHFVLRMAKSAETLDPSEFPGLKPFEGMAMIIEDIDAYLHKNPKSVAAKAARKILLHSRSLTLEGDIAERLAREEKNNVYLEIYYDDLEKEIDALQNDEELVLLGGSFDHAILHNVGKEGQSVKTFNSGLGISKHSPKGLDRFQTYDISNLSKSDFTASTLKELFSAKLIDVANMTDSEKKKLSLTQMDTIYRILRDLGTKKGARIIVSDQSIHAHRMQTHNTCMRNIYLYWLKECALQDEYHAFKVAFSEKALKEAPDSKELSELGRKSLDKRQQKLILSSKSDSVVT